MSNMHAQAIQSEADESDSHLCKQNEQAEWPIKTSKNNKDSDTKQFGWGYALTV